MPLALSIVGVGTLLVLGLGRLAALAPLPLSGVGFLDTQATYQALLFGVAALVLLVLHVACKPKLARFLGVGTISAPARRVGWLGVAEGESWLGLGLRMSVIVTLVTCAFIYLHLRSALGESVRVVALLPWILLFSLTNSFSEEVIYRLGVVVPLAGSADPARILALSAIGFGLPHWGGMPSGAVGVLMAGFLGWLLAKSVLETGGIFWAWLIHFLQDVVIFSAFVMAAPVRAGAGTG